MKIILERLSDGEIITVLKVHGWDEDSHKNRIPAIKWFHDNGEPIEKIDILVGLNREPKVGYVIGGDQPETQFKIIDIQNLI